MHITDPSPLADLVLEWEKASLAQGGPSLRTLVDEQITLYAEFTNALLQTHSMGEVDAIVKEHPAAVKMNAEIQAYIRLAERGLVQLNPDPGAKAHVNHALTRHVSAKESLEFIEAMQDVTDVTDPHEVFEQLIRGMAVQTLLKVENSVGEEILCPSKYLLVHPLRETIH